MQSVFSDLVVVEMASVLAGPSTGLFFSELGAKVFKIENPKTNGDVTRSWKLSSENSKDNTSAYYWSVNAGKEIMYLDLLNEDDLETCYALVKKADIFISNHKYGDDIKLKIDYDTLIKVNPKLIYASITGFGLNNPRTAYDLILQAESGFMFMNGEKNSNPLKLPVAIIDLLAAHQLKEAILIALIKKLKTQKGSNLTVSLFDSAIASLANQATNWLIAHTLPIPQGSLHPNIAPYGELFTTKDNHQITFAIGNNKQFKQLCSILKINDIANDERFINNQNRVTHREELFLILKSKIELISFEILFQTCLTQQIPIGKIRNIKELFELPEAKAMLQTFKYQNNSLFSVKSIAFKFISKE